MPSTELNLKQAIVLRPEMSTRICGILQEHVGTLTIKAVCADGIEREFTNSEQLNSYDNLRSKQIEALRVSARSSYSSKTAALSFGKRLPGNVYFSMTADGEDVVVTVRQQMVALLRDLRPWYDQLATVDVVTATLVLFVAVLGVGITVGSIRLTESSATDSARALGVAIVFGVVGLIFALRQVQRVLFPAYAFAIGEGQHRYNTLDTFRWVVVIGGLVSIVGSVIATILM
jgi:hypothetical protein